MVLTRDQILGFTKLRTRTIDIPEWGKDAKVIVQELTASERDEFESARENDKNKLRARMASECIVDENGKRLFTSADMDGLCKLSAAAMDRIFWAAAELSGMKKEDTADLVKNSEKAS
jgi:endogenous inhibitor of DNA gyrase (YacG/DUF329 family)